MKRLLILLATTALLTTASVPPVQAQKGAGGQVGVARQNPKPNLETLSGTVVAVETQPCEKTTGGGIVGTHVMLKTEKGETLNIHLGWADAVAETAKQLTAGKNIEVMAFRTDKLPEGHYVAQSLKFDGKTVQLRDDSLRPEWAGGGGGRATAGRDGARSGMGRRPKCRRRSGRSITA